MSKTRIETPLARARGLGASGHGAEHWLAQRVTALANIPLTVWLVYSIVGLAGTNFDIFVYWLSKPLNAVMVILFVLSSFYHAALGLQVVIEDYVHCKCVRMAGIIGVKLALFALGVACVFSVLKVAI